MPELPEIEHLRRTLGPALRGATVRRVRLLRRDVVRGAARLSSPKSAGRADLLLGGTIRRLRRHGKELALVSDTGLTICFHLGMSGQLFFHPARRALARFDHVHCVWSVVGPLGPGRLVFRDPRRFGGIWCYGSQGELERLRWSKRGPDALGIRGRDLAARLHPCRRAVKAALLDQGLLAGVGNIYADEILFAAKVSPLTVCRRLPLARFEALARQTRRVLTEAIAAGGSTIRDYRDGLGRAGGFAPRHKVYGRRSEPCVRCGRPLAFAMVAQRATVFCPGCQKERSSS